MTKAREAQLQSRDRKRDLINAHKVAPCMDCGRSYPPHVMDFDHRDAGEKLFSISQARHNATDAMILAEIIKCDLVCSNCHRERTQARVKRRHRGRPRIANENRTHCPQGHEYNPENTGYSVRPNGQTSRNCRACDAQKQQERRDQRASANAPIKVFFSFVVRCVPGKCSRGHLLCRKNSYVYVTPIGANARICRTCTREKDERRKETKARRRIEIREEKRAT